jgi:hypothetical protein
MENKNICIKHPVTLQVRNFVTWLVDLSCISRTWIIINVENGCLCKMEDFRQEAQ